MGWGIRNVLSVILAVLLVGAVTGLAQDKEEASPFFDALLSDVAVTAGVEVGSQLAGLTSRVWTFGQYGIELVLGGAIVPMQFALRGLYSPLLLEGARLYLAPGVSWRSGGIFPHIAMGSEWDVTEQVCVSIFGGVGYVGAGTWLPPGPVAAVSSHVYSFCGTSITYRFSSSRGSVSGSDEGS